VHVNRIDTLRAPAIYCSPRGWGDIAVFEVTAEASFSAAHRLREYQGACERLHGHNYRVRVVVEGEAPGPSGMLVDFKKLKQGLGTVLDQLDHRCLNDDVPAFASGGMNPTAENLALWVAQKMAATLPEGPRLASVTVWESDRCAATYRP
jgi:6-pyruvoyltetrahydropterin/6-carboxytetrahydropterin synthase